MKRSQNGKRIKGFYRYTRMDYFPIKDVYPNCEEQINIVHQIENDGIVYEFTIVWRKIGDKTAARLEIFDDAFEALTEERDFFEKLSKMSDVKPGDIQKLLLKLGYVDLSDHREAVDNG